MKVYFQQPGSLLLELLIVIGVIAIIIPIIAQIVVSSLSANKWSMENKIATELVDESIKAIENSSFEKWQNIYNKTKGPDNHYYSLKSAGSWIVNPGDESLTVNGLSYTRYFTIANVCRSDVDKSIITTVGVPPCTVGNSDDPSTQKITVTVFWRDGTISREVYLTRWRNQVCHQTNWSGTGVTPVACPSAVYESATNIDTTGLPGSLRLQAN
jgi:hypothetical protein